MKQADISRITEIVETIAKASNLGNDLRQVDVEPGDDGLGGEFLRVHLHVGHPERLEWDNVSDMVMSIQEAVQAIDDRFPSIRYRKAA